METLLSYSLFTKYLVRDLLESLLLFGLFYFIFVLPSICNVVVVGIFFNDDKKFMMFSFLVVRWFIGKIIIFFFFLVPYN